MVSVPVFGITVRDSRLRGNDGCGMAGKKVYAPCRIPACAGMTVVGMAGKTVYSPCRIPAYAGMTVEAAGIPTYAGMTVAMGNCLGGMGLGF